MKLINFNINLMKTIMVVMLNQASLIILNKVKSLITIW